MTADVARAEEPGGPSGPPTESCELLPAPDPDARLGGPDEGPLDGYLPL